MNLGGIRLSCLGYMVSGLSAPKLKLPTSWFQRHMGYILQRIFADVVIVDLQLVKKELERFSEFLL